ncbi:GvpL/GvpF family gas vesicle protein [Streptomyces botrytidirepellens]|uniref:Gas vesicle protein n=1 Tax=Streptomyces botrytidirepellens TaxID=2486417 RepID=A0A3M8SVG6_9ACTN|nr:GvpL/GvpF family gas vesicle protein [Streptomyces botrytidirepellens]RNF84685.1 gas vesicle protein [Streptomyces botrytidirepellens]
MTATLTYAYAVCRPHDGPAPTGLAGLDPARPLRTLPAGPLTAIVQDVPAADHTEEALRRRLSDRAELERCARAHHEVITAVSSLTATVPLPLATLYRGDERVREALRSQQTAFLTALDRLAGRTEWGVKVYAPTAPAAPAADPAPLTGRAYLAHVRNRHQGREQRQNAALQAAERVDTVVRGLAVAARRLRPHGAEVTGPHRTHILNAAYLLDTARTRELRAALASLRGDEPAIEIELSGPWAPYSFTDTGAAP